MKKGVATIIIVIMVSIVALFVLLTWESRLLLSVYRHRSLSDILAANYAAESEMFDVVSKYFNYPNFDVTSDYEKVFGLNNVVRVTQTGDENTRTLLIKGSWPFAQADLQLTRTKTISSSLGLDRVEIVMGIDCSSSMNEKADSGCQYSSGTCAKRIEKIQDALITFMDEIEKVPVADRDKYYVGFLPFKRNAAWSTFNGTTLYPTNNHVLLDQFLQADDWKDVHTTEMCKDAALNSTSGSGETNLGTAALKANEYFTPQPKVKQAFILFTDGLPNTALADARCHSSYCSSNNGCLTESIDYMKCGLAPTDFIWKSNYPGTRLPEVDVYAVTVAEHGTDSAGKSAFARVMEVFRDPNYVKKYFDNDDANELPNIFRDIFKSIQESSIRIDLSRPAAP